MIDGAYAEAARFCIRDHAVVESGCGFRLTIRTIPSHSIELASVYLDRHIADVLARTGEKATASQKQISRPSSISAARGLRPPSRAAISR